MMEAEKKKQADEEAKKLAEKEQTGMKKSVTINEDLNKMQNEFKTRKSLTFLKKHRFQKI